MWDPQWVDWPSRFRVTRLDLRGFGRSAPPEGVFANPEDVLAVLDALGIDRAILVGASFGGRVVLDLAASRPDRVRGLVLAGAGLPDHAWSPEIRAFGAAEDEAIEAGDLDAATEINVDFWLPRAPERMRAAIREQQRTALALQVGSDGEERLLTEDLVSHARRGRRPGARPGRRVGPCRLPRARRPSGDHATARDEGDDSGRRPSAEPRAARGVRRGRPPLPRDAVLAPPWRAWRQPRPPRSAILIATSGAGSPVQRSNDAAPCARSTSSPSTQGWQSSARAAAISAVSRPSG